MATFQTFLSHNSKDKAAVRRLDKALMQRNLTVWLDERELRPGFSWQDALEQIVENCGSAIVCVGRDGIGPWEDEEMRTLLRRFVSEKQNGDTLPVIPVLLPGAPADVTLPLFLEQFTWVDLRDGLRKDALDRLQWGITGTKPDAENERKLVSIDLTLSVDLVDFSLNDFVQRTMEATGVDVSRLKITVRGGSTIVHLEGDPEILNRLLEQLQKQILLQQLAGVTHLKLVQAFATDGREVVTINAPKRESVSDIEHVVLLVHGIRDFGAWTERARSLMNDEANVCGIPVKFGYFDALSFLSPFDRSERAYDKLMRAYRSAAKKYPDARISMIAHSFGTFLVGRLLNELESISIHRLILCGSVLRSDFAWDDISDKLTHEPVLNECGVSDPWPTVAAAANPRYGYAGRHGFEQTTFVENQWLVGGHSTFFERNHMRDEWIPFITDGRRRGSNSKPPESTLIERSQSIPLVPFLTRTFFSMVWFVLSFWYVFLTAAALLITSPLLHIFTSPAAGNDERNAGRVMAVVDDIRQADGLLRIGKPDDAHVAYTRAIEDLNQFTDLYSLQTIDADSSRFALEAFRWSHYALVEGKIGLSRFGAANTVVEAEAKELNQFVERDETGRSLIDKWEDRYSKLLAVRQSTDAPDHDDMFRVLKAMVLCQKARLMLDWKPDDVSDLCDEATAVLGHTAADVNSHQLGRQILESQGTAKYLKGSVLRNASEYKSAARQFTEAKRFFHDATDIQNEASCLLEVAACDDFDNKQEDALTGYLKTIDFVKANTGDSPDFHSLLVREKAEINCARIASLSRKEEQQSTAVQHLENARQLLEVDLKAASERYWNENVKPSWYAFQSIQGEVLFNVGEYLECDRVLSAAIEVLKVQQTTHPRLPVCYMNRARALWQYTDDNPEELNQYKAQIQAGLREAARLFDLPLEPAYPWVSTKKKECNDLLKKWIGGNSRLRSATLQRCISSH